jgi:hypothetical protein
MKELKINVKNNVDAITNIVNKASEVNNGITIKVNHFFIDATSVVGIFSLDPSVDWIVSYPEEDVDFENYIKQFAV